MDRYISISRKIEWNCVYNLPYKINKEPYLQSFQYKILNRILNCNSNLFKWKIIDDKSCVYCEHEQPDTIEHRLYSCEESKKFWKRVETWISDNLEINFPFTICEIIFGIGITDDINIDIINFIILLGKWYIHKTKSDEKPLFLLNFLKLIRDKMYLLNLTNSIQCIETKEWQKRLGDAIMV